MKILVTGANGQLGRCLQDVVSNRRNNEWIFKDSTSLDITNKEQVKDVFCNDSFDYVINCAAYTAVDKAERDPDQAFLVNAEGVKNLSIRCKEHDCVLIHISTDFVFDGKKGMPYLEEDAPNPINIYGDSKLKGEFYVKEILEKYFILRTSWVYSEYGNNFVKTMLRLGTEKEEVSVVNDQIGSPTYAGDLAKIMEHIIEEKFSEYGIYNYSSEGNISWYEFAKEVFVLNGLKTKTNPIFTKDYPTPAKRPKYSVLNKQKIKKRMGVKIDLWKTSLERISFYKR